MGGTTAALALAQPGRAAHTWIVLLWQALPLTLRMAGVKAPGLVLMEGSLMLGLLWATGWMTHKLEASSRCAGRRQ